MRCPVINARLLLRELGISTGNARRYVDPLTEAGIIVEFTDSGHGIVPEVQARVLVPDLWSTVGFVPRSVLVALYNAADLYVSVSAEGFGLTIAEAEACGVATVALDYSAVPEVVGPCGTLVPVDRIYDNEYAHHWALPTMVNCCPRGF
jgi:glycosyltransferase involved in cell wall biosynthesis